MFTMVYAASNHWQLSPLKFTLACTLISSKGMLRRDGRDPQNNKHLFRAHLEEQTVEKGDATRWKRLSAQTTGGRARASWCTTGYRLPRGPRVPSAPRRGSDTKT